MLLPESSQRTHGAFWGLVSDNIIDERRKILKISYGPCGKMAAKATATINIAVNDYMRMQPTLEHTRVTPTTLNELSRTNSQHHIVSFITTWSRNMRRLASRALSAAQLTVTVAVMGVVKANLPGL